MAGRDAGKLMVNDDLPYASLWRRWLQPLESVQENSSPPLDIAQLEFEIEPAVSGTDAKFRKAILATVKTALSSARQTLQASLGYIMTALSMSGGMPGSWTFWSASLSLRLAGDLASWQETPDGGCRCWWVWAG